MANGLDDGQQKKGLAAYLPDILGILRSVGVAFAAYMVFTNKVPKKFWKFYSYFYVLAIIGALGFMGEKVSTTLLAFFLPALLVGSTIMMKLKPEKYPLEDWWEIYSLIVIFTGGFVIYLFMRWEQTKKLKDGGGKDLLKARVDPKAAADFRRLQEAKGSAASDKMDAALGQKEPKKLKGAKKKEEEEPAFDPNESIEDRMEREMRQLKDEFGRRSMKLSTTLLRMKNLAKSLDRDEIFDTVLEIVSKGLDADKVQLLLNDDAGGKLFVVRAVGMKPKEFKDLVIPHEEASIIAFLAKRGKEDNAITGGAMGVKECEIDPKTRGLIGQGKLKTVLAAPIPVEDKVFGVINVEKMKNADYSRDDQNLISTCADIAGLVMKNAHLFSATMDDLTSAKKLSEEQLKQNEQLKGSMARIVSPSVAEMIMKDPSQLKLGGQKCQVTVFFSDIRGFTSMSEGLDPEDLVKLLNIYFTRMTDILMNLDGTLDKYVGDELMALFGAPVSRPDDPIRAVLCAVQMIDELRRIQKEFEAEGKPVFSIGIGINTGEVTAGYMGSEKQLSYTVIGDNVNLGARLCSAAKKEEIIIARSTYEVAKDYFEFEALEPIMVKGKSKPIEIYRVLGIKADSNLEEVLAGSLGAGAIVSSVASTAPAKEPEKPKVGLREMTEEEMKQNIKIEDEAKVIECAHCGTENDMQEKFCTKCGMPIF